MLFSIKVHNKKWSLPFKYFKLHSWIQNDGFYTFLKLCLKGNKKLSRVLFPFTYLPEAIVYKLATGTLEKAWLYK